MHRTITLAIGACFAIGAISGAAIAQSHPDRAVPLQLKFEHTIATVKGHWLANAVISPDGRRVLVCTTGGAIGFQWDIDKGGEVNNAPCEGYHSPDRSRRIVDNGNGGAIFDLATD